MRGPMPARLLADGKQGYELIGAHAWSWRVRPLASSALPAVLHAARGGLTREALSRFSVRACRPISGASSRAKVAAAASAVKRRRRVIKAELLMTDDAETRRRRAAYRACHRGTKEMDWMLGRFAEAALPDMSAERLGLFERLLALPDPDLQDMILHPQLRPAGEFAELVARGARVSRAGERS